MFASPIVLREAAAPVDTAILLVALAALEVAESELCEAVLAVEEADEAAEAMDQESARSYLWTMRHDDAELTRHGTTGRATSDGS